MNIFQPTAGPGDGLFPGVYDIRALNHSGAAITAGAVLVLDFFNLATGGTSALLHANNNSVGVARSGFSTAVAMNSAGLVAADVEADGVTVVALEGIADDKFGNFRVYGVVTLNTASTVAAGDQLAVDVVADSDGLTVVAVGLSIGNYKVQAKAMGASAAGQVEAFLNGWLGFGSHYDVL